MTQAGRSGWLRYSFQLLELRSYPPSVPRLSLMATS